MYEVSKRMEISAAHKLCLDYKSKCLKLHGHNYIVYVYCKSPELNSNGMVVDFTHVKDVIQDVLDHHYLNEVLPEGMNPTAENMAKWMLEQVNGLMEVPGSCCYKVTVQESEGNVASYIDDEA